MDGDEFVSKLRDSDGAGIEVEDTEGNVWRGVVDYADYTQPSFDKTYDDGHLRVETNVSGDDWQDCPGDTYSPTISVEEDGDGWGDPSVVYDPGTGDSWSAGVRRVQIIDSDGEVAGDG